MNTLIFPLKIAAIAAMSLVIGVSSLLGQNADGSGASAPTPANAFGSISQAHRTIEVLRQYDQIATTALWPGFTPAEIPIAVYDGTNTFLYHHPKPPQGFQRLEKDLFIFQGRHPSVIANTNGEVNGVAAATADISQSSRTSPRELAALLVHESFHVYGKRAHPGWAANEVSLFTFPVADVEMLQPRRLETLALVRALQARTTDDAACWARAALEQRQLRFSGMPADAVSYERGTELNEGLAQYIEYLSIQKAPALSADDFPAEMFRHRGYATGQAFATLLDRFAPDWKAQISDRPIDELLRDRLPGSGKTCAFSQQEVAREQERARRDSVQVTLDRQQRRERFQNTAGWTLHIVAATEPLSPQMFDPWNVSVISSKETLHSSLLKLGNNNGEVEIRKQTALTLAAGPHPLFTGVSKVTIKGLERPAVTQADGKVIVEAPGVKAAFRGSVEQSGEVITISLR